MTVTHQRRLVLPNTRRMRAAELRPATGIAPNAVSELAQGIDVLEESVRSLDAALLDILLCDRTTGKNILWATADYASYGPEFGELCEITPELITGKYADMIQPRVTKSQSARLGRTRDKAEVFTPSWICNKQNNLVDSEWFGRENVFNIENGESWTVNEEPIIFGGAKGWREYVDAPRMEIACGEAPYLVSRYDTATGKRIPLARRIGLLDRKMRVVRENTSTAEDWLTWAQRAFESVYGFEYQGDNLLLARENLLYSYIEYYRERFRRMPDIPLLREIARIISWNIWQMDGLKCVVPNSCMLKENRPPTLMDYLNDDAFSAGGDPFLCPGCAKGDITRHTGNYCRIMDWRTNRSVTFLSMMKGGQL